jgi:hypothetical protein
VLDFIGSKKRRNFYHGFEGFFNFDFPCVMLFCSEKASWKWEEIIFYCLIKVKRWKKIDWISEIHKRQVVFPIFIKRSQLLLLLILAGEILQNKMKRQYCFTSFPPVFLSRPIIDIPFYTVVFLLQFHVKNMVPKLI